MGIKCGIVGLPNVGKSTLFNALTKAGIPAANFPFCTIDPNVGVVAVPDPRLQALAEIVKPQKIIPTTIEFVDVVFLVDNQVFISTNHFVPKSLTVFQLITTIGERSSFSEHR